jgi:hypothetical protein
LLDREGFTEEGYNFRVEIISLVEDFCLWLEEKGFEFEDDLQLALTSYFALLEIRDALQDVISDFEKLPIFEGLSPQEAYEKWRRERGNGRVIKFRKRSENGD